ncbi:chromosome partitioning protein ParA [Vibrio mexicanus]|uniref:chromosome partitioning protein ParA n=1 Tax=Vibrio mexicanus TaxID=1004326 RepID=UPI00063C7477|nr:chromosome partitioning protein ParA [Vibrio mexicanus]
MNNKTNANEQDDDVVVIEQRDSKAVIYITLAAALGLALGALVGSSVTASKWEKTYHQLEKKYATIQQDKTALVEQVEIKVATVEDQVEEKLAAAIEEHKQEQKQQLDALEEQVSELEKVNMSLEAQLAERKEKLEEADSQNNQLVRQADMQALMFERSRELFQRELLVKQELAKLEEEREKLYPTLAPLKEACDLYLAGTSWDVKSDSCDRQDAANSRISEIDQMIQVHKLDLRQIQELADGVGL